MPNRILFIDDKDLRYIVNDEEIFAAFHLLKSERTILFLHLVQKQKFEEIAEQQDVTKQRIHYVYKRSFRKMKAQLLEILRSQGKKK